MIVVNLFYIFEVEKVEMLDYVLKNEFLLVLFVENDGFVIYE